MSTTEPVPADADAPRGRRSPWLWVSAVLALCCAGLLVWALTLRSDLDTSQQQVDSLQAQIDQQAQTGDVVQSSLQAAYDQIVKQLGTAKGDLNALTQDIEAAKQTIADADERARAAASDAADRTQTRVDEAEAKAESAAAKTRVAADCAKAYLTAFGKLFEGNSIRAQVATVRQDLQNIAADCQTALGGA